MRISDEFIEKFKKGSVPDGTATNEEIDEITGFLFSTIEWMQEDYEKGEFKSFNTYDTSLDVTLSSVEDAIAFNSFHEGLHLGTILSLLKVQTK